jgi:exo-beta-1,3-glucanase (GH17 family)
MVRRPFAPRVADRPVHAGISYGPFRAGQRPGGPGPTREQILEDLTLIAQRWQMIRIYSSRGPAEDILRTLREHDLPVVMLLGAWIAPNAAEDNAAELSAAIHLANSYPDQVVAVSVGNETQVAWSGHRSSRDALIAHIRTLRAAVKQPVTTADDYNFWNKPESHAVADEIDFLLLHAYAMWNKQSLADAVQWTKRTVASIARAHPQLSIVLGETGWATELLRQGDAAKQITAAAGEAEQATFFAAFSAWATEVGLPYFYFEAFDEPWKGGADPRDIEKHWGLYRVDRTPKAALIEVTP